MKAKQRQVLKREKFWNMSFAELMFVVKSVLNSNAKLSKEPPKPVLNQGVTFAPGNRSGEEVCDNRTPGCFVACVLWFAGHTVTLIVRMAMIARTVLYRRFPEAFYPRLHSELARHQRKAEKLEVMPVARLNVASDIWWPNSVMEQHPAITFYDYTKDWYKARAYGEGLLPVNMHITFSVSEETTFQQAHHLHLLGVNLAVVFNSHYDGQHHNFGQLPQDVIFVSSCGEFRFATRGVDGNVHDVRIPEFDGRRKTVGLRANSTIKGKREGIKAGFIMPCDMGSVICKDKVMSGVQCVVLK